MTVEHTPSAASAARSSGVAVSAATAWTNSSTTFPKTHPDKNPTVLRDVGRSVASSQSSDSTHFGSGTQSVGLMTQSDGDSHRWLGGRRPAGSDVSKNPMVGLPPSTISSTRSSIPASSSCWRARRPGLSVAFKLARWRSWSVVHWLSNRTFKNPRKYEPGWYSLGGPAWRW